MTAEKFPTIAPNTYKENQIADRFHIVPNHLLTYYAIDVGEVFFTKVQFNFDVSKSTKKPNKFFEGFLP
mgnify:CR=1 FL=1